MVSFKSDSMSKLCSRDQLELLDSIDRLRLQGINNYVSLPQIIVCGDQSSGKSSVLEAISGVSFPVSSNLCTRFPTELVLRRAPNVSATVSIVPHQSRSESEQISLKNFQGRLDGFSELPKLVEGVKLAMGINVHGRAFSKDILRIEITGPDRPHLTIVDLPGLIHSATKHQSASDVQLIGDVVQGYMKESRCIILAVVSAKNDFANQVVVKLARAADSSGTRTLGVITKPDDLVPGSDRESLYISLAKNRQVDFRLGWHVLKNMDSEKGQSTLCQRDAEEAEFFSKGAWSGLPRSHLGIDKLRERLSKLLLAQITSELPSLVTEISQKFESCQTQLEKLGDPRASLDEQRRYLLHLSQSYQTLVKASTGGNYTNKFFGDAMTDIGYRQRLRAIVQNLNQSFASDMMRSGHLREIVTEDEAVLSKSHPGKTRITQKNFLAHIEKLMSRTRGCELPGTFNPMIVADLFWEQSQPWESIVHDHIEKVQSCAGIFIALVIEHIADASTQKSLLTNIFAQSMREIRQSMRDKTAELLLPHRSGHPITYNHYFIETIQKVRRDRVSSQSERVLCKFFNVDSLRDNHDFTNGCGYSNGQTYDLQNLAESLTGIYEPDMNPFAAMEALDCLQAYYKVALKRFIDDVAVEVIESKLVSALEGILSPVSVYEMDPELVARIAGESEESRTLREQLTQQREVLRNGLETCKRFSGLRVGGDSVFVSTDGSADDGRAATSDNHMEFLSSDTRQPSKRQPLQPQTVAKVAEEDDSPNEEHKIEAETAGGKRDRIDGTLQETQRLLSSLGPKKAKKKVASRRRRDSDED